MYRFNNKNLLLNFEKTFDLLGTLESIIQITHQNCLYKEIKSLYYGIEPDKQIVLSRERNDYINMLKIALEQVHSINSSIHENLSDL